MTPKLDVDQNDNPLSDSIDSKTSSVNDALNILENRVPTDIECDIFQRRTIPQAYLE